MVWIGVIFKDSMDTLPSFSGKNTPRHRCNGSDSDMLWSEHDILPEDSGPKFVELWTNRRQEVEEAFSELDVELINTEGKQKTIRVKLEDTDFKDLWSHLWVQIMQTDLWQKALEIRGQILQEV